MTDLRDQKSTIVRLMALLERVSPALGGRIAERLWFTVPTGRPPKHARPDGSVPFTLPTAVGRVVGERWGEGPVVYLVHGWGGRRTDLDALVAPLVAAGHSVVSFDAPSHGDSGAGPSGRDQGTLLELAEALTAVVAAQGPAHAVVGHSLGAMATIMAVADGLDPGRLALVAPATNMEQYTHGFARRLGFGERTRVRLVRRIERRLATPISCFTASAQLDRIAVPPPLLLVHDRGDVETPWSGSAALADRWPGASLVSTSGLGHRRVLRDPATIAALAFARRTESVAGEPAGDKSVAG